MSTAKHTLGPWKWDASWGWNRLIARDGTVICDDGSAGGEYSAVIDPSGEEHEKANARLIAAAPAMLEALTEFLKHDGGPGSLDYDAHKRYEARKAMVDAVLAARRPYGHSNRE